VRKSRFAVQSQRPRHGQGTKHRNTLARSEKSVRANVFLGSRQCQLGQISQTIIVVIANESRRNSKKAIGSCTFYYGRFIGTLDASPRRKDSGRPAINDEKVAAFVQGIGGRWPPKGGSEGE